VKKNHGHKIVSIHFFENELKTGFSDVKMNLGQMISAISILVEGITRLSRKKVSLWRENPYFTDRSTINLVSGSQHTTYSTPDFG